MSFLRCIAATMLGSALLGLAPTPSGTGQALAGDFGYAGMSGNDTLVPFVLATGTAVAPAIDLLPEGDYPYDATIHPWGHEVWVCGAAGDGVVVVETATNAVLARIPLGPAGAYPVDIVFGLWGRYAYVSSRDSDAVVVLDVASHSLTGVTIPIAGGSLGPGKMVLNPATGEIYLVDWYDDKLNVVDPLGGTSTSTSIGNSLWDLEVDSAGSTLYVTDRGTDEVHVVELPGITVLTSIAVGADPWGIDLTPDDRWLLVANEDSGSLSVIDTASYTVTTTIPLGGAPRDVDISADGALAYVPTGTITGDDGLFVIDVATQTLVGTISLAPGSNTNVVAVTPQAAWGGVFADDFESGDTSRWSATVP